ncbi:hypothetical protein AcW1_002879 [Taiwanofungus camphoratus]|nr:hypothetical protein AcV5_001936 [Antrodia cinnamomea]KAI0925463.1 hypothetical protein AcV7_005713 [Antrodia cinnamomea]KAI0942194.1 hypothetical protein AcW1_002879 [Antrodia cinnamomea]
MAGRLLQSTQVSHSVSMLGMKSLLLSPNQASENTWGLHLRTVLAVGQHHLDSFVTPLAGAVHRYPHSDLATKSAPPIYHFSASVMAELTVCTQSSGRSSARCHGCMGAFPPMVAHACFIITPVHIKSHVVYVRHSSGKSWGRDGSLSDHQSPDGRLF